jgi:hypothetical protein
MIRRLLIRSRGSFWNGVLGCEDNVIETRTSGIVSLRWRVPKALTWTMVQESSAMEESTESPIFSMFTVFKARNVL